MKSIDATLVALFVGLAVVTQGQAEEYYIYQGPNGELVISNKEPRIRNRLQGARSLSSKTCPRLHKPKNLASRNQTYR